VTLSRSHLVAKFGRCIHSRQISRDEAGVLSAYVAVLAVALLVIVGMAVDTGRAIAAQRLAADEAEQAARSGAGRLSLQALREGKFALDIPSAVRAAEKYTIISGHPGTATAASGIVSVRVVVVVPTTILGIVGVQSITVSATSSASDVRGITRGT
jgi:Flp pilus assembly protein TadG